MAETQTIEQIQRLSPYVEGLEKRVLGTAFGEFNGANQTSPGLLDTALDLPDYQVAGMDPLQLQAMQLGQEQVGSYQPSLEQGQMAAQAGIGALGQGVAMLDPSQGISSL